MIRRNMAKDNAGYFLCWRGEELLAVKNASRQSVCCKRAYIRGAFIASQLTFRFTELRISFRIRTFSNSIRATCASMTFGGISEGYDE